jgi:hypothetical protein
MVNIQFKKFLELYDLYLKKYLPTLAISTYLDHLKDHQDPWYDNAKRLLQKDLVKITVKELEESLAVCAEYLDPKLEEDYAIGFVPRKSSKWIAELALPHLSKLPSHHFEHETDNILDVHGQQSSLAGKGRRFVVFDDVSYSGKQLYKAISSMQEELLKERRKGKLFLVVPFISDAAEKWIIDHLTTDLNAQNSEARLRSRKLKIHLITSERKIIDQRTFTEWKIPDSTSLPDNRKEAEIEDDAGQKTSLKFLTNYPPCYREVSEDEKKDKTV